MNTLFNILDTCSKEFFDFVDSLWDSESSLRITIIIAIIAFYIIFGIYLIF